MSNSNLCHDHPWDYVVTMHPIRFLLLNYKKQVDAEIGERSLKYYIKVKHDTYGTCFLLLITYASVTSWKHTSILVVGRGANFKVFLVQEGDLGKLLQQ